MVFQGSPDHAELSDTPIVSDDHSSVTPPHPPYPLCSPTALEPKDSLDVGGLELNRYPDPKQLEVKSLLADMRGVKPEQIFVGVGSDEAIDLLIRIFCKPGEDSIIVTPPTYGMYKVGFRELLGELDANRGIILLAFPPAIICRTLRLRYVELCSFVRNSLTNAQISLLPILCYAITNLPPPPPPRETR